ncbi:LysR family transcriptional regulator [Pandoraea terrae]|uniref:LysR family transcriptional regulator n=1 Tax=Pandoraea terrae TaxID=1537710 RepID=A0A5E4TSQ0_9BURK|nr:LysR family transcriptional regulator [Pandoraea terrae]VVD90797.1 LysR family transcriptional regulator [Pandoraea terrae]
MNLRHLPLGALFVFDTAAAELSFARAADRLFVTQGAVSRQIRTLEDALGVTLFERRNRAVFLTLAGAQLHATTRQMFDQLAGTVARLRPAAQPSPLVVSCEPTLAMRWLIPRLGGFYRLHPEIALHLHTAGGPLDLAAAGVDIAIRRNDFFWGHALLVAPIGDEWVGPIRAVPGTGAQTGAAAPRLLHTRTRAKAWADWRRAAVIAGLAKARADHYDTGAGAQQTFEHFYLSLQAAGAGLGVAIGSVYMVADELAAGRIDAPEGFVRDGSSYVALSVTPFDADPARAALLGWLRDEMRATLDGVMTASAAHTDARG